MDMKTYILSHLNAHTEGSTYRGYCPSCGGQATFTATVKMDAIVFGCYRAGCDVAGKVYLKLSVEDRLKRLKYRNEHPELLEFVKPDYWIDGLGNDACLHYMQSTNMMSSYREERFRPMYDPAERRFVFPIKQDGKVVGGIGRSLIGEWPKTTNYNETYKQPFTCGTGSVALLVEDCASAVAASRNPSVTGIALLGTNIRQDFIPYFSQYSWVGVALDPDAYSKSMRLKQKLSAYLKDIRILKLPNDIKDLDDQTYDTFIIKHL